MRLWHTDLPKPALWPPPRDRDAVTECTRYARLRDPIGHRVHVAFALLHCFTLPLATVPSAITFGCLFGYAVLRLPNTWRCYPALVRMPIVWLFAAWGAWAAISLLWSRDSAQGFDELGAMRMLILPIVLWPVLELAPHFIAAALLGVLGQNIAQALEHFDITHIRPQDEESTRTGGLIHPIQTGAWCAAAMAWWLAAALRSRWTIRWLALGGMIVAGVGLIVTESRGAWVAAGLTLMLMLIVEAMRRREARRPALVIAVLGVVFAGGAWLAFGDVVSSRITDAIGEYRRAERKEDYRSPVGLRIGLVQWSVAIFRSHPVAGVGAGSFRIEQSEEPSFQKALDRWPEEADNLARDHPHHTYLHALVTGGVIEGVLLIGAIIFALRGAWRDPADHPFADGSFFVILSWLAGGMFDCYQLNGHTLGLLMLAVAVTMPLRPKALGGAGEPQSPGA